MVLLNTDANKGNACSGQLRLIIIKVAGGIPGWSDISFNWEAKHPPEARHRSCALRLQPSPASRSTPRPRSTLPNQKPEDINEDRTKGSEECEEPNTASGWRMLATVGGCINLYGGV